MERRERRAGILEAVGYLMITLGVAILFIMPGFLVPSYWTVMATAFVLFVLLGTLRYYLSVAYSFRALPPDPPRRPLSVDIVVPVMDEARVLPRNIRSLLDQEYDGPIRVIYVIDRDCSDASARILGRAAEHDDRIVIVPHEGPAGKVAAINAARGIVRADVVGFVDADVSLSPDVASRAAAHIASGTAAVKGRSTPVNKHQGLFTAVVGAERDIRERIEYYSKCAIGGFTVLTGGHYFVGRQVLDEMGWFDEGMMTEDMDLAVRLQAAGLTLAYDPAMNALEEAPGRLSDWYSQRHRWYRGWLQGCRGNLRPVIGSRALGGFHRADTLFQMSSTILAPLLVMYYALLVTRDVFGLHHGAMFPYEVTMIASSVALFTPMAILLMAYHDRRSGRPFPWVELPAVILILPYLLIYSIAAWHAFLDEFVLRRPNIYRKYPRSGFVDPGPPA
ncbi:MAG: glycosyltransferase family 2 protein [Thermoplasmata archaeon]|nr:glycosyltransferase family 2 protein [Thermoplasmata archaeon]